jgi:hypothetical protein
VYLHFGTNRLSGTIPDAVGALAKLKVLDLSQNLFTAVGGGICAIQAHLTISCDISGNEISGASNYPHIQMNCPFECCKKRDECTERETIINSLSMKVHRVHHSKPKKAFIPPSLCW